MMNFCVVKRHQKITRNGIARPFRERIPCVHIIFSSIGGDPLKYFQFCELKVYESKYWCGLMGGAQSTQKYAKKCETPPLQPHERIFWPQRSFLLFLVIYVRARRASLLKYLTHRCHNVMLSSRGKERDQHECFCSFDTPFFFR